ncbi:methyl-accepting chemotaxis protein [Evansella caseinilytica]|uniref:Methyl-accepting chemotaxis protein n=1 Tax=Evansella caseinilytica TaxID=1503961 RepID=A0A1H3TPD5_9BACI|nr:methyl-accepting chemotaxis protein [Evansella caseinilytica]SDZ52143.1 methyl-accepting chemotaxis protein [Evansella caseinilytica]
MKRLLKKLPKWEGKLIHKLILLMVCIFIVSAASSIFIYSANQQVTNKSLQLEEAAELQQKYTQLLAESKQIGLLQLQLVTSGYSEDRVEHLQESLGKYQLYFGEINGAIAGNDTLEHYFSHFDEAFSTYEQLYERYFQTPFTDEDLDRIRSRVSPHIIRTEDGINSVDDRIYEYLAAGMEDNRGELYSSITATSMITLLLSAALIIVPLIFLLLFGKNIASGVKLVMDRIKAYKGGNLSYDHSKQRSDEFDKIDSALEELGKSLQEILVSNERVGRNVTHVAEQTSKASYDQLAGMERLQETVMEFTNEVEQQTDFTNTISSTTEEVSASSQEIQSAIEMMTEQMNGVDNVSKQGVSLMQELQRTIQHLNENTLHASRKVSGMEKQLGEINRFIDGIDAIAAQTNLLALNASIEAARAGTAGKSFSVVADEIRKLSSETNQFSNSTKNVLTDLNNEIVGVVEAFDQFLQQSRETVAQANEALRNFTDISGKNNELANKYVDMSLAIEQINEAMEEVVTSVSQLVEGANCLQDNNRLFKEVIDEQTSRQKELTELANSLYGTAKSLKKDSWHLA